MKILDLTVEDAISKYGQEKVGVYMIAFDEVAPIFIQAYNHPMLSKLKWYGSDGSALNDRVVKNHDAALFALNTSIYNPIYGLVNYQQKENKEKLDHLNEEINNELGRKSSSYAAVAYDSLWVAALAGNQTRSMLTVVTLWERLKILKRPWKTSLNHTMDLLVTHRSTKWVTEIVEITTITITITIWMGEFRVASNVLVFMACLCASRRVRHTSQRIWYMVVFPFDGAVIAANNDYSLVL